MSKEQTGTDPLGFMKGMWEGMGFSLPGMVAPTFDSDEIEKRIADLKAVEGWLRMNLSMLQMTIQGLEMQNSTLSAVKAMSKMAGSGAPAGEGGTASPALWPWNMMQQMQAAMPAAMPAAEAPAPAETSAAQEENAGKKAAGSATAAAARKAKKG